MRKVIILLLLVALGCTAEAPQAPDTPRRIISLAPSVTEILFAIGAGEQVVGVTTYCNYPEKAAELPKVGDFIRPDFEKIVALKPDLAIATTDSGAREAVGKIQSFAIATLSVDSKRFQDLLSSILIIGEAVGRNEQARKLAAHLKSEKDSVAAMHAKAQHPATLLLYGVEPLVAAGEGSLGNELIEYAGGRNVFADSGKAYVTTDFEKILSLAPEVIVQVAMGTESNEQARRYWSKWISIPAVRNGRIYVLNPDLLTRPGPRIIKGLRLLEKAIHSQIAASK